MMKRNPVMQSLLLICVVFILPVLSVAGENRRDGNWWSNQDRSTRSDYVSGFLDGVNHGNKLSYWSFLKNEEWDACSQKVRESYGKYTKKYFKNVNNVQLVDGLDSFYTDFRNRPFLVVDAVWFVVNAIAGAPQEELDSMIKNWRASGRE